MPLPTLCILAAEFTSSARTTVRVYYSAAVNATDAATAANYSATGLTVTAAAVNATPLGYKSWPGTIVDLTVTGANAYTSYSLTASNIRTSDNSYTMVFPDNTVSFNGNLNANIEEESIQFSAGFRQPRNLTGVGFVLTYSSPSEIEDDADAPTFAAYSPSTGTTLTANQQVSMEVLDFSVLHITQIFVKFETGEEEVVYDGTAFTELYVANSTKLTIFQGYRFIVQRENGWLENPTFLCFARDSHGNTHNLSTSLAYNYTPTGGAGAVGGGGASFNTGYN